MEKTTVTWYPWLTEPYRQMVSQYRSARPHHALLLHFLPGSGVDRLVTGIGSWLMCQQPNDDKTCGQCHSCHLMKAGNHPDWHVLTSEKGKQTIGVEQIRELIATLHSFAQQGGRKGIWIAEAEKMSESAANALLKTLEEPPAGTYFFLGCHQSKVLPATVRSRCRYYHLSLPKEEYSIRWLEHCQAGSDRAQRATALRLTGGAPLAAQRLLSSDIWQQRERLMKLFTQAVTTPDWLLLLTELGQDNVLEQLHWLYTMLLDASKYRQQASAFIINQDQLPLITQLAAKINVMTLHSIARELLACRHQLITVAGLNRELILTDHLYRWERLSVSEQG